LRRVGLDLAPGLSEAETRIRLEGLAATNRPLGPYSFLGAGCYQHFVPAAVRVLTSRGEFVTAYTPYQPEASQGTLQSIFEFQTCICELTGLEVANASLYDGPSALAEAAFMGLRLTQRQEILVSGGVFPEAAQVVETYAAGPGIPVRRLSLDPVSGATDPTGSEVSPQVGVVLVQQPNCLGVVEDLRALADAAHAAGTLLVVSTDPSTLGILEAPGRLGADIVVGDAQVFGNAPSFGGPSVGFLACAADHVRQIPGRLVGQTIDLDGRICYTLTLQAREQHIRRAKATSNICSNEALNALAATIHLALLGPQGLRERGEICLRRAHHLHDALCALPGVRSFVTGPFFSEFALALPCTAEDFAQAMRARGIDPGVPLLRIERGARPLFDAGTTGARAAAGLAVAGGALGPGTTPTADGILVAVTEVNPPEALEAYLAAARDVLALPAGPAGEGLP
ncbi:MAG: aminomethyl-transferring glycine dehydrogenase subunit GcvPA, partial [Actinomycetia bacterium]|nr:aminomethyl-transferring glycine dehydrogenase subunit GcvPA [Actinomycetes bacterium]